MNDLVLDGETFQVARKPLVTNCETFLLNPSLQSRPYVVRSRVSRSSFAAFVDAIGGSSIEISATNARDLELLCREFTFADLSRRVSAFLVRQSSSIGVDADARRVLASLRDHDVHQDLEIVSVQQDALWMRGELSALRECVSRVEAQNAALTERLSQLCDKNSRLERSISDQQLKFDAQQRELAQLRDEFARTTAKASEDFATLEKQVTKLAAAVSGKQFAPGSDPLEGIIAHLTSRCGGNVHDCGVVNVTSSAEGRQRFPQYDGKSAADLKQDSLFISPNRPRTANIPHERNNWLCYDFKDRRIVPTHYSIRSEYNGKVDDCNLKSWLVEVSMDGQQWTEIDRRENNSELNGRDITRTFNVSRSAPGRLIRLVNIGRNHQGSDTLLISSWEIFGSLVE
jgi:hypothetical protein